MSDEFGLVEGFEISDDIGYLKKSASKYFQAYAAKRVKNSDRIGLHYT